MTHGDLVAAVAPLAPRGRGFDRCLDAGRAVVGRLKAGGVDATLLRCRGALLEFPHAMRQWRAIPRGSWVHYIVEVPHLGITIDVTRRQFDPEAARVAVSPRRRAEEEWEEVERIDP